MRWVATEQKKLTFAPSESARGSGGQRERGQENSHAKEPKAANVPEKKDAKLTAQGARKPESQGAKPKGSKKGNQRSLTAFFGGPK